MVVGQTVNLNRRIAMCDLSPNIIMCEQFIHLVVNCVQ